MSLHSALLGASQDLVGVADGTRTISAGEQSDSVALIQQALLAVAYLLPFAGVDDVFGEETGGTVAQFKRDRGLQPSDPVVGRGTTRRLDLEVGYLEGTATDEALSDVTVLAADPLFAGVLDQSMPALDIGRQVEDFFQLGDRLCFRLSFVVGADLAKLFGRYVEGPIFRDYCALLPPCSSLDFVDASLGSGTYTAFLAAQHPGVPAAEITALGRSRRPDLLSNRPGRAEWYEIKPASVAGGIAAWRKFNTIIPNYGRVGLPYLPGTAYTPSNEIPLLPAPLLMDGVDKIDVVLHVWRSAPGLIFYEFCVKGDYVRYFNRVRLVAGILAILIALPELIPLAGAAEEAGAIIGGVRALASQFGVQLPTFVLAP